MRVVAVERPTTLDAVLERLSGLGDGGRLIAGGTALVPQLRADPASTGLVLLSLDAVDGFSGCSSDDGGTVIGAGTRLAELECAAGIAERFAALAQCLAVLATPRIRQMATVGGALALRDAGHDLPVVLAALDARVRLCSRGAEREVTVEELWPVPGGNSGLRAGEVVRGVVLPYNPAERSAFVKLSPRTATDRGVVSVAVALSLRPDGRCARARVVVGGLDARLVRSADVERRLMGAERGDVADAVRSIVDGVTPPSDVRGTSDYRRKVTPIVTRRALHAAWPQS